MENLQIGVWLDITDPQIDKVNGNRLVAKFESGQCKMYNDEWDFETVTHVLILPE